MFALLHPPHISHSPHIFGFSFRRLLVINFVGALLSFNHTSSIRNSYGETIQFCLHLPSVKQSGIKSGGSGLIFMHKLEIVREI
jgi:hypothetical protein